jgi:GWxTD domain-containing protein
MKTIINFMIAALFIVAANLLPGHSTADAGSLALKVDTACFPEEGDTLETLLEVYYTLPRYQLQFAEEDGVLTAAMDITLRLDTVSGDSVDQISWRGTTSVRHRAELEDREYKFFDTVPAFVRPGEYVLTVSIKDVNSDLFNSVRKRITVPDYASPGLKLSQIQLAYSLNPDTVGSSSAKNGVLVIPNASSEYTPEDNFVFFYSELHGMEYDAATSGKFEVEVSALDNAGQIAQHFYSKEFSKPGISAVISNGVNGYALADGNYNLRITATDLETGSSVESMKPFTIKHRIDYVFDPMMRALYQAHPEAFKIEDEETAKLVRNEIEYIATGEELRIYDSMNLAGKNGFMKDFWKKRDPDPKTELNEFEIQHYARWDYANESFVGRSYQEGWATDMGRIFILYGPPAESENSGIQIDQVPHEIWRYYNIPRYGEAIFVFVDQQGHGEYRLFHSNVKGEKYVYEWEEKLQASKTYR